MRNFFLFTLCSVVVGFGLGVSATSSAQTAADRIVVSRTAAYCEAGLTEFCK